MIEINKIYCGEALELAKQMPDTMKAYLAGIIDGEAYIGIKKSTWGMRNRDDVHSPTYHERVQIRLSNKKENMDVLKILKDFYGGSLYIEKKIYSSENSFKTKFLMISYGATDKVASKIIKDVFPYLIIKKKQAENILKLRESKESKEGRRRGSSVKRKMSQKILDHRENLCQEIKEIHSGADSG